MAPRQSARKGNTMESQVTRRNFVKTMGLASAGATGAYLTGGVIAPASADEASEEPGWDLETEVLVCGYGAAGASGAIEAADNGAKVLIIEKAALPGGSMARCGGAIMGAGTKIQAELGVEDSPESLMNWFTTCINAEYELCPEDIMWTFAERSAGTIDWLTQMCTDYCERDLFDVALAVSNEGAPDADFSAGGNGVTSGCLNAVGAQYDDFGISREEAVPRTHWAHSPGGAANSGPELFEPMYQNICKKIEEGTISAQFNTALSQFILDDNGAVIGAIATTPDGEIRIKATKGILLATGGYCASDEMKLKFCQEAIPYFTYMCLDCVGEGITAAMRIGADLYNMCNFQPVEIEQVYQYDPKYNDVFNSWLDMDDEGYMEVPEGNMAECHGGVCINTDAQVIDVDGNIIPHLYASGNDVGTNFFGKPGHYPGCGAYVGFALTYGRIAGANMAAETPIE